ncbi:hypothetical protein HELRODRAFT_158767 [Helobdella robusta]|uniref:Uncharacterized protein n=1 Tax=Helobdella robusta TaxID=6412 RepID=T1EN86_HELRO|nr:hypothetical protein HELRODRAFT_158767 [Helobdella robusta]ESO12285.1 hypothetical protein HELRODRAFT_158767 [Helobdella robusta]
MASSKSVKVCELLYFINNNSELINEDTFIYNTSEFYNSEDINVAIKLLKTELELLKLDKTEKFPSRGSGGNKREKLVECLNLFKYFKANNLLDKLPDFCSINMDKIPNMEKWLKLNFEYIKNEIKQLLSSQQTQINKMLLSFYLDIENLKTKFNNLENVDKVNNSNNRELLPAYRQQSNDNLKDINDTSVFSNSVETISTPWTNVGVLAAAKTSCDLQSDDNATDDRFTLVQKIKKRSKSRALPTPAKPVQLAVKNDKDSLAKPTKSEAFVTTNQLNIAKPTKIVGSMTTNPLFTASKSIIRKKIFYIGNVNLPDINNNRIYKKGGGTGFLIRNSLNYEIVEKISHNFNDFEWSGIKLVCNSKPCYYICIYRPPSGKLIDPHKIALVNENLAVIKWEPQYGVDLDSQYDGCFRYEL